MTPEEIQRIKDKYKNPVEMKKAIGKVADVYANTLIKSEINIKPKIRRNNMAEGKIKSFEELEKVLLNQIETLNEEGIFDKKEEAKMLIDKSKAISDLVTSFTDIQRLKLDFVKTACKTNGIYDNFLRLE